MKSRRESGTKGNLCQTDFFHWKGENNEISRGRIKSTVSH